MPPRRPPVLPVLLFALLVLLAPAAATPAAGQGSRFTLLGELGAPPGRFVAASDHLYLLEGEALVVLRLRAPGAGADPPLARLSVGRGELLDLALDGRIVYVLSAGGLSAIDVGDPGAPRALGFAPGGGQALATLAGWVYIAARQAGLRVVDARDPARLRPAAAVALAVAPEAIAVSATSPAGGPLLLVGGPGGARLLAARDPQAPVELATLTTRPTDGVALAPAGEQAWLAGPGGATGYDLRNPARPQPAGHYAPLGAARRVVVRAGLAYVAERASGLAVFDLRQPARPLLIWSEQGRPAHDLAIVTATGVPALVLAGPDGLRVYDLADPERPRERDALALGGAAWGLAVLAGQLFVAGDAGLSVVQPGPDGRLALAGQLAIGAAARDVVLAPSGTRAYVALAEPAGLAVVDVRDPARPQRLALLMLSGRGEALAVHRGHVLLAAGPAGLHVIDALRPSEPRLVTTLAAAEGELFSDLVLGETRAYVAAGTAVLVVEASSPARPTLVARLPAPADGVFLAMAEGLLAAVGSGELHWVNVRVRSDPVDVGVYRAALAPLRLAAAGNDLLVASGGAPGEGRFAPDVVRVQPVAGGPGRELAHYGEGPGDITALAFDGTSAVFSAGPRGLLRYDLSEPGGLPPDASRPATEAAGMAEPLYTPPAASEHLALAGTDGLLAGGAQGGVLLGVGDPQRPEIRAGAPGGPATVAVAWDGSQVLAAARGGQVHVYLPGARGPRATWDGHSQLTTLSAAGTTAAAGDSLGGLHVLDLSDPLRPVGVARLALAGPVEAVELAGGYAYVAAGAGGLRVVDLRAPTAGVRPLGEATISPTLALAATEGAVATLDGKALRLWRDGAAPLALATRAERLALLAPPGGAARIILAAGAEIAPAEPATRGLQLRPGLRWPQPVRVLAARADSPAGALVLVGDDSGLGILAWPPEALPQPLATITATGQVEALADGADSLLWTAGARLAAVDLADPAAPALVTLAELPRAARALAVAPGEQPGGSWVVAGGAGGLTIYAWDGRTLAVSVDLALPGDVRGLAADARRVYAALDGQGVAVVELPDGAAGARLLTMLPAPAGGGARGLSLAGPLVVAWGTSWQRYDVSQPAAPPAEIAALAAPGTAAGARTLDVAVDGGLVALSAGTAGVWLADVSDPAAPRALGVVAVPGEARALALARLAGGAPVLYVALGTCGLQAYDLSDPGAPRDLGGAPAGLALDVAARGDQVYLADAGRLRIWRFDPAGLPAAPEPAGEPWPEDGAIVTTAGELRWRGEAGACGRVRYDVYLAAESREPAPLATGLAESRWPLAGLAPGRYLWRVDARGAEGQLTAGPAWRFALTAPAAEAAAGATATPGAAGAGAGVAGSTIGLAILGLIALGVLIGLLWRRGR
jgi:hypothetical protein